MRTKSGEVTLWSWLRAVVRPVAWASRSVAEVSNEVLLGLSTTRRLVAGSRRQSMELEEERARTMLLANDVATLRELTRLLPLAEELGASSIAGRVMLRNVNRGRMELSLAVTQPVRRDTPVVTADGVVGRVLVSDAGRCWVQLITHPAAAVAVRTEPGELNALAVGAGGEELAIEFVPRSAQLLRGAVLLTSGADGIYPPGLPVARVAGIRESAAEFLEVRARSTAKLGQARVVLLLTGWQPSERESP